MRLRSALNLSLYILLLLAGMIVFGFPIYWMTRGALISQGQWIERPLHWWPVHPTLDAFREIIQGFHLGSVLFNTFTLAILTMACNVIFDTLAGFSLAKMRLPGRESIYLILLITMMVPFEGLMVPLYLIVTKMGLANTLPGVLLPGAASAFSIVLMRQFFSRVPNELIEAARVDGAGWPRIFFSVAVPIAKPAIATVAIISFLSGWEAFIWPMLITDPHSSFDVLQKLLAQATYASLAGGEDVRWPWLMAAALIATLPVMVLFVFGQRYFIAGLSGGAVKG